MATGSLETPARSRWHFWQIDRSRFVAAFFAVLVFALATLSHAQERDLVLEQRYLGRYPPTTSGRLQTNRIERLSTEKKLIPNEIEPVFVRPNSFSYSGSLPVTRASKQFHALPRYTDRIVDPGFYENDSPGGNEKGSAEYGKRETSRSNLDIQRTNVCANSISAFLTASDALEGMLASPFTPSWSTPFWALARSGQLGAEQRSAVGEYDAARQSFAGSCLSHTELDLASTEQIALSQAIGFFRDQLGTYCTGIRISNDLVLTAGHCFFDLRNAWQPIRDESRSKFYLAGNGAAYSIRIYACLEAMSGKLCSSRGALASDDKVLVRLLPSLGQTLPAQPKIAIRVPNEQERLVLVGYASEFQGDDIVDPSSYVGTAKGVSGCMVKRTANGCIKHGCQARGGFSGAPLFRASSDGTLALIGIHLGADNAEVDGGQCDLDRLQGNLGIDISSDISAVIASQSTEPGEKHASNGSFAISDR